MAVRYVTAKCLMGLVILYGIRYYYKYNTGVRNNFSVYRKWNILILSIIPKYLFS